MLEGVYSEFERAAGIFVDKRVAVEVARAVGKIAEGEGQSLIGIRL